MPRALPALPLEEAQRQQLQQWNAAFGTPRQVALRCQIVLAAAEGESDNAIAQRFAVSRPTVSLWRARFAQAARRVSGRSPRDAAANLAMGQRKFSRSSMPLCRPNPRA